LKILANAGWAEFTENLITGIKEFFNPDLSGYQSFELGSDGIVNIHVIVFGIFIGVMLAAVYSIYTKKILGKFIRKLLAEDITSAEKAKTPEELGFSKNPAVLLALGGYTLGRVVNSVEKDEFISSANASREIYEANRKEAVEAGKHLPRFVEPKFDKKVKECRYYIAEKNRYTAEMRFNDNGSGYGTFFFVLLVACMCVIAVYAFLPQILNMLDSVLSGFTVEGNTHVPQWNDIS
jgi:hypothetical protein